MRLVSQIVFTMMLLAHDGQMFGQDEHWISCGEDGGGLLYYDANRIERDGDHMLMWIRRVSGGGHPGNPPLLDWQNEFDCTLFRYRSLQVITYSAAGEAEGQQDLVGRWQQVPPDSGLGRVTAYLCERDHRSAQ